MSDRMGAPSFPRCSIRSARLSGSAVFGAALMLVGALAAQGVRAAPADAHAETLAALADTRAAMAEIVQTADRIVNSPTPYRRAALRAANAVTGESDREFDRASGNPGDEAGALGHLEHLLDRRGSPPWVPALHGAQVNLMAAVARLRDAFEARELEDYQIDVTKALLNLQAAVGRPTQPGVFGGLTGTLATTTLGIPQGARQVPACEPNTLTPAYGVQDGYLAFVAVPASSGTAGLSEDFGSLDVRLEGDRLVVRTQAEPLVAALCAKLSAAPTRTSQAQIDSSAPAAPTAQIDSSAPQAQLNPQAPAKPQEGAPPPAVYTLAQAKAGRAVFTQHCIKCHGANLQGTSAPAVAGTDFLQTAQRNGWTLATLRYLVFQTMPFNSPGTLTPEQYASVMAFLLAANCFPSGGHPFPQQEDDAFKSMTLHPPAGAKNRDAKLGTCRTK